MISHQATLITPSIKSIFKGDNAYKSSAPLFVSFLTVFVNSIIYGYPFFSSINYKIQYQRKKNEYK